MGLWPGDRARSASASSSDCISSMLWHAGARMLQAVFGRDLALHGPKGSGLHLWSHSLHFSVNSASRRRNVVI